MDDMPKTTYLLTAMGLTALYLWRVHRTPHIAADGAPVAVQPADTHPATQTIPPPSPGAVGPLQTVPDQPDPVKGFLDALGGLLGG